MVAMARRPQTIYDRIIAAMRTRGRSESDRQICAKLGLSPTYLSQLKASCQATPDRSIDVETAGKFAREFGIDIETLVGMESDPTDDPYPSRAAAVTAARALQFSQSAIDAAYREDPGTDPGRLWWFRRIEAEESRLSVVPASRPGRLETQRARSSDRPSKR